MNIDRILGDKTWNKSKKMRHIAETKKLQMEVRVWGWDMQVLTEGPLSSSICQCHFWSKAQQAISRSHPAYGY